MAAPAHIQQILDNLPTKPGVYIMRDEGRTVIYVGKAKNLRNRVRSYYHSSAINNPYDTKVARLVAQIADIEIIVTGSELEALLTEVNLIKRYRPHFNVRLKDDKRYPYIKIHWADPFPKVTVTRRMDRDGSRYFGPYTSAWAVHQTLDVLRRIFPYLTCDRDINGQDERACLYYDIKRCNGPCIGAVSQDEYRAMIDGLMQFLQGRTTQVTVKLQADMLAASEALEYEKAAVIRDQLAAIDQVVERQRIVSAGNVDQDVIAFAREGNEGDACVQIFFIRAGRLIGREYFVMEGTEDEDEQAIMGEFLKQFYEEAAMIPREVLLPHEVEETVILQQWLNDKRGDKVTLTVPRRGKKRELVALAAENASETLGMLRAQWHADKHRQETALREIEEALNLPGPPNRIECYDISNTQGTAISASRVVFVQGTPRKSEYRKFSIKSVQGHGDDYASMREVLTRRFKRWADGQYQEAGPGKTQDAKQQTWSLLPDLLIVDGGKGQLGVAVEVLEHYGLLGQVPVIGLAKQREEIFVPGQPQSILLPRRSQGLYLVQRVRDEAHRFALAHHRKVRRRVGIASILDTIPGIGPSKRKALLQTFGSIEAVRAASEDELAQVKGITPALASVIKAEL